MKAEMISAAGFPLFNFHSVSGVLTFADTHLKNLSSRPKVDLFHLSFNVLLDLFVMTF